MARSSGGGGITACVLVGVFLAAQHGHHGHGLLASLDSAGASPIGASAAIRYARAQIGKPYEWGAEGPRSFDCSGLTMMAERAAGHSIPRTSEGQWADLRHVSHPRPGDLVLMRGASFEVSPGHVGIVIGHGDMVEAPGTGLKVRIASYHGRGVIGFVRP